MTSLRIKIRWFKRNKNSFFYKLFAFIFPLISPTLSFELKMYRIVKINRVKFKKKRKNRWLFDKRENIRSIVDDEIIEMEG